MDVLDGRGWLSQNQTNDSDMKRLLCGDLAKKYFLKRDKGLPVLLKKFKTIITEYDHCVEEIEGYVYMNCVGIQLEKHLSKKRVDELAGTQRWNLGFYCFLFEVLDMEFQTTFSFLKLNCEFIVTVFYITFIEWEKKTNVSTAFNAVQKKGLHHLVGDLQDSLESLNDKVSHTSVKEAKDKHLASKTLTAELQALAIKRMTRSREKATDKTLRIIKSWVKCELLSVLKTL